MKRVLALLVIAVCAVWSVLLLGPRRTERARAPREAAVEASAATDTAQAPTPSAKRPRGAASSAPAEHATEASASTGKPSGVHASTASAPSSSSSAKGIAQAARAAFADRPPSEVAPAEGTGELGEGVMSPDYVEMESTFMQEPREGAWAIQHEVKIRELFYASDIAEQVVLINCRSSVCRMQFRPQGNDPFGDVLRTEGVAEYTGIDSTTPYSLNGAELIIYARPKAALATAE